jgi:hypothetical protein
LGWRERGRIDGIGWEEERKEEHSKITKKIGRK